MIHDCATQGFPDAEYDFAIVGAGAVGLILTAYLVRKGMRVVLLESGGHSFDDAAQRLNEASSTGVRHEGVRTGRARALGGTTNLWGGQLTEFTPMDLLPRSWMGQAADWPINFEAIAQYYPIVYRLLNLDEALSVEADIWRAMKVTPPAEREDVQFFFTRWLKDPILASTLKDDLLRPEVSVLLRATAERISIAEDGTSELHVAVGALRATFRARCGVMLSAGTIENIRLFLQSAQSHQVPWKHSPWIGTTFQDHLDIRVARLRVLDRKRFSALFDSFRHKGVKYQPRLRLTKGAQEKEKLHNAAASISYDGSISEQIANVKLLVRSIVSMGSRGEVWQRLKALRASIRIWLPLIKRYLIDRRGFNVVDNVWLTLHIEQRPVCSSRVSLGPGRDSLGRPELQLHWSVDGDEIRTMREFAVRLAYFLKENGLAHADILSEVLNESPDVMRLARDTNHHCGGLRMGASDLDGVVDGHGRVFGTSDLYVCGAAVFRTSSYANPTLTAMALALRSADHAMERRRERSHRA